VLIFIKIKREKYFFLSFKKIKKIYFTSSFYLANSDKISIKIVANSRKGSLGLVLKLDRSIIFLFNYLLLSNIFYYNPSPLRFELFIFS
jgi:hypothetical protein